MEGGRGGLFAAVVVLAFTHFVFRQVVVIVFIFLCRGLLSGAFCQTLSPAGGILLVDGKALFVDAAAHVAEPLPALGGRNVKNVQTGAGRQRRHDQIGGGSAAEQQERPAQHSAQRTAREPCAHTIMITGGSHLRGGLVGGDVRKDDDRAAGEDEPQHQLCDMGQKVFAPGVEDGQIAQRRTQHETSAAEHAEQDIVHRAPGRTARHESQRHEHQPRKQGDEPRGHPVLCPVLAARGCAAPGGLAFSLCHVS